MVRAKCWTGLAMAAAVSCVSPALAQQTVSTPTVPSYTPSANGAVVSSSIATPAPAVSSDTYFCQKCQRYHTRSGNTLTSASLPPISPMTSPVMQASASMPMASSGGISNVLGALNAQRARRGLGSLAPDPQLQAVAQQRAALMARTGRKGHPPGSFSPGRYEGVGWSSSYSPSGVSACFTSSPNMRVAGAAMATGRDGVYFCVVYR